MEDFPEFITNLPELDIALEGASGHILFGENQQVVFIRFDQDVDVPAHSHRAQLELVVGGELVLNVEGEENTYREGQYFYIPEGKEHSAYVKEGYRAIVFFDQPDRYTAK